MDTIHWKTSEVGDSIVECCDLEDWEELAWHLVNIPTEKSPFSSSVRDELDSNGNVKSMHRQLQMN